MPSNSGLEEILMEEMRDILDAERQLTKALPRLARAASNEQVRAMFQEHLEVTRQQIERLTEGFAVLGGKPRASACEAMRGLVQEAQELIEKLDKGPTLDAALIGAAQKVEHYEIASYGTARTWASRLGQEQLAQLLEQTLEEEKSTDQRLTELAEELVNPMAEQEEGEGEDEGEEGEEGEEQPQSRRRSSGGGGRARGGGARQSRATRKR